jgi:hypothetical protein
VLRFVVKIKLPKLTATSEQVLEILFATGHFLGYIEKLSFPLDLTEIIRKIRIG